MEETRDDDNFRKAIEDGIKILRFNNCFCNYRFSKSGEYGSEVIEIFSPSLTNFQDLEIISGNLGWNYKTVMNAPSNLGGPVMIFQRMIKFDKEEIKTKEEQ